MAEGGEFVEGWVVAQVLGEGAYGEVRLLVHSGSGACVALKAVRAEGGGAREAALHRALRHPHVLRCLGERRHPPLHYLFLEYAQGGELFDRIEPDEGMPPRAARRYWRQLAAGLRYLHERGVAHRDLKPENLLLDHRDRLKISDFGMATLFRVGARERLLERVCGTLPYAAPEVLRAPSQPYRAPPADVWAAALVLLAMLAGELPWERASAEDARFAAWSAQGAGPAGGPWARAGAALPLLRAALRPDAAQRATLPALQAQRWLTQDDAPEEGARREWCSQPAGAGATDAGDGAGEARAELSAADMDALLSYSQPAQSDELLLSPADGSSEQEARGGAVQRLVRRVTRVWLRCDAERALSELAELLDARRIAWRRIHPRILAIECGDEVKMRAWALPVRAIGSEARALVEFRRSRGCWLAFKRHYVKLRDALAQRELAAAPPPRSCLLALRAPLHALAPAPAAPEPMDD